MIIITDPDKAFRDRIAAALSSRPDRLEVERPKALPAAIEERADEITVVLLGPNIDVEQAINLAASIQMNSPEVGVLMVHRSVTPDLLRKAMRRGVRDVLPMDYNPEQLTRAVDLAEEISRAMRAHTGRAAPPVHESSGEHGLFTVIGPKGGVGKSFIASNLAVILAKRGHDVALLDLDLESGDMSTMLQLDPTRTICDVMRDLQRLDDDALRRSLTKHRSGASLLAAPAEPGEIESVSVEALPDMLRALKAAYRYVIVDTPATITDHSLAAVDQSDLIVGVATMDVPSIKGMRSTLRALGVLGVDRSRMRLVLNRADSKVGISMSEVEKTLEAKIDVSVPSSREVPLSINLGSPISLESPRSPVTRSLVRIVDVLCGSSTMSDAPRRFRVGGKR